VPPLAAGAHDIEQAVQQAAHVRGPRPPAGFSRWDERLQQPILIIAQRLAGPKIPNQNTIFRRPHTGLQAGEPPNAVTTAAYTSSSRPAHPFKTGCKDS